MKSCKSECGTTANQPEASHPPHKDPNHISSVFIITEMDCPTEEQLIRSKLETLSEISAVEFNLMRRQLTVTHAAHALDTIVTALKSIGFNPQQQTHSSATVEPTPKHAIWPLIVAGFAATGAEVLEWIAADTHWGVVILTLTVLATVGLPVLKKGWVAIRNANLNINALMTIAVTGALFIGHWPEAAMVTFLFALAEWIESKSLDRARYAIHNVLELAPESALVLIDDQWQQMQTEMISIGSRVRLQPGERVPLDGTVVSGHSSVNQAPITGESMPIEKTIDSPLFAGSINMQGALEYITTATRDNSTLARIIHAVEEAQSSRAPTQRFIDRFAKVYTPIVVTIACLVAVLPPLFFDGLWSDWIYKALVLLVIACPCALVISTPVAVVSALTQAARQGILIKGGVFLEQGKSLTTLAFDKTGTLTHGTPVVTQSLIIHGPKQQAQRLAASLASRSDHPVSQAIHTAFLEQKDRWYEVSQFEALLGRGSSGMIQGQRYYLGNHRLIKELGLSSKHIQVQLNQLEQQGHSVVILANTTTVLALFTVADTVREQAAPAVAQLHTLGIHTLMLSGDNQHTAETIAAQVGIEQATGEMLPEDKLRHIQHLQNNAQQVVGMVGDGINDAPALAQANISFAMAAAGSDSAVEAANIALMDTDLRKIPQFIHLSQRTSVVLKQNISFAIAIKLIFLILAVNGQATMWMAVFADLGASLLVILNSLRLLKTH
ncbi:heavy metal translocating P-type ATPase [Denitrificimonas sp. JX-1]|uniref:P-type Zn(2+) transporter n=1 Tax=Denitrificimonas halotolerans TaxID=3098930 RepID=A0ABU5GSH0_9GAMM|nr:heavy metal translocating P-type ATPase [Denitrificimonas sp. JX-1]MDY7219300.1 heavy metal translocating P-type ATPase [Denitrificimonas sp. JX-1]